MYCMCVHDVRTFVLTMKYGRTGPFEKTKDVCWMWGRYSYNTTSDLQCTTYRNYRTCTYVQHPYVCVTSGLKIKYLRLAKFCQLVKNWSGKS
jgi:hypothetical protein